MMRVLILILISALLFSSSSQAQEYSFEHLSMQDGLPSNRVYFVFKDSKGFMWFCTDQGVSRYNGIDFENFTTKDGLGDNDVFNCFEDKWGRIWFATNNGELSFFENETFFNQSNCQWLKGYKSEGLIHFFIQNRSKSAFNLINSQNNETYFEIDSAIIRKKAIVSKSKNTNKSKLKNILLFVQDTSVVLKLIDTSKGANRTLLQLPNGNTKNITNAPLHLLTRWGKINSCNLQLGNSIYDCGTGEELLKTRVDRTLYTIYEKNGLRIHGHSSGLVIIKKKKATIKLKNRKITGICEDEFNNIFISTYSDGVHLMKEKYNSSNKSKIESAVLSVGKIKREVYLVLRDKKIYNSNKLYEPIHISDNKIVPLNFSNDTLTITTNKNWDLIQLYQLKGKIHKSKLHIRDLRFRDFLIKHMDIYGKNFSYTIDKFHNLIIADNNTIITYNLSTNVGVSVIGRSHFALNETPARITSWAKSPQGFVCIIAANKVYYIERQIKKEVQHLSKLKLEKISFLSDKMIGITNKNELLLVHNYFDSAQTIVQKIETLQNITSIKPISSSMVLGTNTEKELFIIEFTGSTVKFRNIPDFLQNYEAEDIHSDSTYLYINRSTNDAIVVPIKDILINKNDMYLYFKNIQINEKYGEQKSNKISIDYNSSLNIELNYHVVVKTNVKVLYEYAIVTNKQDTVWQTTKIPHVQFNNPSWGNYTVLMRAVNSIQQKSNIVSNRIIIKSPLYVRWWFILLIILLAILATYLITRQVQKRKRNREKDFLTAEFKALNALMNPHFIFNSLNNIQGFINSNDKLKANEYLEIFSKLVRQNMHNIEQGLVSLEKEVSLIKNYLLLEKMRMGDKLNYTIIVKDDLDLAEFEVPPLTIQPIVENAVKHGIFPLKDKSGQIEVIIEEVGHHVSIKVIDNGIGFSSKNSSGQNNSIALATIKKRFQNLSKILGKELSINIQDLIIDTKISGTIAEIQIEDKEAN